MTNKRATKQKANASKKTRRKLKVSNSLFSFLKKKPRVAWWVGGIGIVALYIWAFYYFFVCPTGFRWRALYGDARYPQGYEIHGIDISHYQGDINWNKLRHSIIEGCPLRFIIIKSTEGSTRIDEKFKDNFYQAREHGFTRGAYHFYSVHTPAYQQATHFMKTVKLENGDLPPVLDVEHKPKNQTDDEFKSSVHLWLDMVEKHYNVKPIIYTYFKFKMRYLNDSIFNQYPYWIAHYYVDSLEYQGQWKFWQHTDVGRLPGIKGNVDFNIYNGSYYDLRQMTIGSQETIGEKAYSEQ